MANLINDDIIAKLIVKKLNKYKMVDPLEQKVLIDSVKEALPEIRTISKKSEAEQENYINDLEYWLKNGD